MRDSAYANLGANSWTRLAGTGRWISCPGTGLPCDVYTSAAVWKEPFRLPNARNQGWIYTCHVSSFERPHSESLMKRLMKREKRKRSDKAFARFTLRRTTEVVEKNFSNRRAATVPRINIDRRLILFKTVSIKSLVRIFFPDPRKRKATLCSKSENHAWKGREREREYKRVERGLNNLISRSR